MTRPYPDKTDISASSAARYVAETLMPASWSWKRRTDRRSRTPLPGGFQTSSPRLQRPGNTPSTSPDA
jgi:hypothetical protein